MATTWIPKYKTAVVIGIENYRSGSSGLPTVGFARKDAEDFKKLLLHHFGFQESEITLWLDQHASKSSFENELAYLIKTLPPDSFFVFYYAGHGFAKAGQNLLTCWDTFAPEPEQTSIPLRERILEPLINAGCEHSLAFLDACAKDVGLGRDAVTGFQPEELRKFTTAHPFHAQFMACSPGEASYPSSVLNNGIWTWHLINALSGSVPAIISPDRTITDQALRDYLAQAVPYYVTHKTTIKASQTPWANISAAHTFIVQSFPEKPAPAGQLIASIKIDYDGMLLRKVECFAVSDFDGFDRKFHKVPKWHNRNTQDFVEKISAEQRAAETREIYDNIKDILGRKFRDITKDSDGYIVIDIFRFTLNVEHDSQDTSQALVTRTLQLRCKPEELPDDIDDLFPYRFEEVVLPFTGKTDFGKLVSAFEQLAETYDGDLDEDEDEQFISYRLSDQSSVTVKCGEKEIIIKPAGASTIKALVQKTQEVLKELQGQQENLPGSVPELPPS